MENQTQNQTIIVANQKSTTTAAVLGFFFGPLGMLYSTISGAIIMFIISAIVGFLTVGIGLIVTIPICSIWAYLAAKKHNEKQLKSISN